MNSKQQGYALVAVLWAITLLTIMAASFSLTLRRSSNILEVTLARAQGIALANAGLTYTMLRLAITDPKQKWQGGSVHTVRLPGGAVRVRLFDEAGKIDINAAQFATLSHILGPLLGDTDKGSSLANAIIDWRDTDDVKQPGGAEATEYLFAQKGYVPSNRGFQAIEELQMVLGMTPALYKTLEPMLTIYTGQDGINPQMASRQVLAMLPGVDSNAIASFMQAQQAAASGSSSGPQALASLPMGLPTTTAGDVAYTVVVEAIPQDARQPTYIKAVIKRERVESGIPFVIANWKQQYSAALD